MRSTKSIILLVIALGCGLIAAIGFGQVMKNSDGTGAEQQMETIFVAAGDIPSWTKLDATLVKTEEWPTDKIPQGAARTIEEFQAMSPMYPLYPGEPIVKSKLSDGTSSKIPSVRIPEGHQVFTVKVDRESALSGLVNPGDKVDVLVFIRGRSTDEVSTGTRTIMRNVTVFAVNDQIARSSAEESSIDAKTVSLLVRPEQSERLLLAKQLGTIHLALRKPGDESKIETLGALPGDLNGSDDGSDGEIAKTTDAKPTGGIFDILTKVTNEDSTAVDSSNATDDSLLSSTMIIMSPDGVIGSYTFDGKTKENGLPELPAELLQSVESDGVGDEPETDAFEEATDGETSDDDGDDDSGSDETLDSILGL